MIEEEWSTAVSPEGWQKIISCLILVLVVFQYNINFHFCYKKNIKAAYFFIYWQQSSCLVWRATSAVEKMEGEPPCDSNRKRDARESYFSKISVNWCLDHLRDPRPGPHDEKHFCDAVELHLHNECSKEVWNNIC